MSRVRVRIRTRNGTDFSEELDTEITILDLKLMYENRLEIESHQQRILFNGSLCSDDASLESLGLQDGDALWIEGGNHHVPSAVPAGDAPEPSLPSTGSAIGSATMPLPQQQPPSMFGQPNPFGSFANPFVPFGQQQPQQQFGSPFSPLMGGFNLNPTPSGSQPRPNPFAAFPGMGAPGSGAQQPFDYTQMMQNPAMRSMMESMTSNPEVFRNIFNNNPAFQRILEDNPQLRHILNDDQLFQSAMRAATDPEYYNEMLRSNDRALQNIESLPGGFSALSKMYNQIQRPMEDAMDDMYRQRHGRPQTVVSDVDSASVTPTRDQMPNPWAPNGRAPPVRRPSRRERLEHEEEKSHNEPDEMPRRRDPALVSRVMGDEEQKAVVRDVLANPESLRALVERMMVSNPELRERVANDPQLQEMLTDPKRMSQLLNPAVVEQVKQQSSRNEQAMKELYERQLSELVDNGFCDQQANLAALCKTNGDVDDAILELAQQLADAEDM